MEIIHFGPKVAGTGHRRGRVGREVVLQRSLSSMATLGFYLVFPKHLEEYYVLFRRVFNSSSISSKIKDGAFSPLLTTLWGCAS